MVEPTVSPLREKYRVAKSGVRSRAGAGSGGNAPPRRKRRTPSHPKGTAYPGMWGKAGKDARRSV